MSSSVLQAALALPLGLGLLILPPLLRYQTSVPSDLAGPDHISTRGLMSALLCKESPSSIWLQAYETARPTVSRILTALITPSQQRAILEFDNSFPALLASFGLAILGLWATSLAIRGTKDVFKQRGFKGRDLMKTGQKDEIPESMGLPSASVYMLLLFLFIPFRYFTAATLLSDPGSSISADRQSGSAQLASPVGWEGRMDGKRNFPHHELASYLSALLSFLSAIVLGFLDDVFDIRWRYKLPIPVVSSIPLLMIYYAGGGGTTVVVPGWPVSLRHHLGTSILDLGPLYYVYMSLLSTFCTNSINILAGINGVEVGQALVICVSLCVNDLLYLDRRAGQPGSYSSEELLRRHLFSLYFLLPLAGVCIGLLSWNRYPAKVFVGDTFCYFAGMVFSAVGILGHFSKTLLLFFVPQIFNFLLSCPQLFGLVPNPRHRVPRYDAATNSLYPSVTIFGQPEHFRKTKCQPVVAAPLKPASRLTVAILMVLEKLRMVQLEWYPPHSSTAGRRDLRSTTNLTLLNAILVFRGVRHHPQRISSHGDGLAASATPFEGPHVSEYGLWCHVMALQALGSAFAFAVRYHVAAYVFPS